MLFSAVLNNVTTMIIVGSLTGVSLRKLGREDKLLGFFVSLFVVISVMEHAQVLALISAALVPIVRMVPLAGSALVLLAAALFSSVTDNIPLARCWPRS